MMKRNIVSLSFQLEKAPHGSNEKLEAQKRLADEIAHRERVDNSVKVIGDLLFGEENSTTLMANVRPAGQPLVDDWDCFKKIVSLQRFVCTTCSGYDYREYIFHIK